MCLSVSTRVMARTRILCLCACSLVSHNTWHGTNTGVYGPCVLQLASTHGLTQTRILCPCVQQSVHVSLHNTGTFSTCSLVSPRVVARTRVYCPCVRQSVHTAQRNTPTLSTCSPVRQHTWHDTNTGTVSICPSVRTRCVACTRVYCPCSVSQHTCLTRTRIQSPCHTMCLRNGTDEYR